MKKETAQCLKPGTVSLLFWWTRKNPYIIMMDNSSEHQRNEKSDYANLFAIGWIFISEWAERPLASDKSCECSESACNARVCGLLFWTSWTVTYFLMVVDEIAKSENRTSTNKKSLSSLHLSETKDFCLTRYHSFSWRISMHSSDTKQLCCLYILPV